MVHRISLYKFREDFPDQRIEDLMREARIHLLKLPEARHVRCGKRIPNDQEWPFFIAVDFETRHKMRIALDSPIHVKFLESTIKPVTTEALHLEFETDPLKDVRYS